MYKFTIFQDHPSAKLQSNIIQCSTSFFTRFFPISYFDAAEIPKFVFFTEKQPVGSQFVFMLHRPHSFFCLDSHPLHIKHTHANWTSRINRAGKIINAGSSSKPCVITGGYLYTYIYIHYTYTIIYICYIMLYIIIYICVTYWYLPGFLRIFWGSLTAGSKYIISQAPSHCPSEWCPRWNLPAPPRCSPCWRRLRGSPRRNQWRCLWRLHHPQV